MPKQETIKYPKELVDERLEIAYCGLLHENPKSISRYYLENQECCFSVPGLLDIYKLVIFREGQAYVLESVKGPFSFPRVTDETPKTIETCKKYAKSINAEIESTHKKIKKLFLLKKAYLVAPTEVIQRKILQIRNYVRYEEMTIEEIQSRINNLDFLSSIKEAVMNEDVTDFLLTGDNNLTTGISLPFPIMSKTFKGFRKGETASFAMPSNAGKSRFVVNLLCHLAFVEHKKVLLISNEMTEDKMKLCLITTIVNSPEIQGIHGQKLHKREAELLALKFRPNEGVDVEVDKDGFILQREDESRQDFLARLSEISEEYNSTVKVTDWVETQGANSIFFVYTSDHTNDELKDIILDYYYKEGIEYFFYDTLKTDIENIGNIEEIKKTATVLSTLAQKYEIFIGSTLQLAESSTAPLNMNINDIATSRTVKEVLDNLCLIKEVNNGTYDKYEVSDEEDSENYTSIEIPKLSNTKYYACVVDKNRAGSKPRLLFRLNLDFNRWEEMGYVRLKQTIPAY